MDKTRLKDQMKSPQQDSSAAPDCRRRSGRLYFSNLVAATEDAAGAKSVYFQTLAVFEALKGELAAAGTSLNDIVEVTVTLSPCHSEAVRELGDAFHDVFGSRAPETVVVPAETAGTADKAVFDVTVEPTPLPLSLEPSVRRPGESKKIRPWWLTG